MRGHTHVAVGVSAMAILTAKYGTQMTFLDVSISLPIAMLTAATGSLLPDIDLPMSKMGSKHPFISKHLKHRGITHTLLVPAILTFIMTISMNYIQYQFIGLMLNSLLFGLIFGWTMHIFADLFNRKGVPIFWPITKHHFHIATVTTGTWQESAWLLCYFITTLGLVYWKGILL